jgi:hypothetical protein
MAAGTRKKLCIDLKYTNNQLHIISTVLTFINNYICIGDYANNQLHITTAVLNPYISSGDYTNNQLQITTAVFNPSQIITYAVEIVCTNNQVFLLPY